MLVYTPMELTSGQPPNPLPGWVAGLWNVGRRHGAFGFSVALLISAVTLAQGTEVDGEPKNDSPGLVYTNSRVADVPWSINVIQLDRTNPLYQIQSVHARGRAIGLDTLSGELGALKSAGDTPVAAINGDYYQRDKAYQGAPRGLQIVNGELLSGPSGGASFWIDAVGEPHTQEVESRFQITWPDGTAVSFGLNGERRDDGIELYTAAIGPSTRTKGGCELILEQAAGGPWLPLHLGRTCKARIREIRQSGDTPLASDVVILSVGPSVLRKNAQVFKIGEVLQISTASEPPLHGIRTAIGGGPVLVHDGQRKRLNVPDSESYQVTSMLERHPRSAIGWNERCLFLVEVDGRQRDLSVGMTLDELAKWLIKLGCQEAMNFDGGGSATLWHDGQVRNSPCDGEEREIANGIAIVKKKQ